jgi:nucleophosmin 1
VNVQATVGGETFSLCNLQKDKVESHIFDIYFRVTQKVSFSVKGKGEVHLTGYWEPTEDMLDDLGYGGADLEGLEDEEEEDDEEALAAVSKNIKEAKKNSQKNKVLAKPRPDDEEEDDDEEDDEDLMVDDDDEEDDEDDEDDGANLQALLAKAK